MKLRCDLQVNDKKRKLIIAPFYEEELPEHGALRLAACVLFADQEPYAELSAKHPALADEDYRPDAVALDDSGRVKLWVQCGRTTPNKLDKITRRYNDARIVVLTKSEQDARRMKELAEEKVTRAHLLEHLAFRQEDFRLWFDALREDTYVIGEASGLSLNVVVNDVPLAIDLVRLS